MAYTTIDNPELYFQCKNYTGNGTDDTTITLDGSEDMAIAFSWIKNRNTETKSHQLVDTARGFNKYVFADTNQLEQTQTDRLKAWTSDGFTLGDHATVNQNTINYASWHWKGGTTSGITTNGSTNVTPSAYTFNQTSKFSALKYAGNGNTDNQVAHGIGSKPDFMMVKNLDGSINSWAVFHKSPGNEKYFELDVANAMADGVNRWQDTDPDTVNFTTGNSDTVNNSSYDYICYAWSEVQGYSKFGTYTGQAGTGTSGPFVYLGFRPSMVLIKNQSSGSWLLFDNKRASTGNVAEGDTGVNSYLEPNTSGTEQGDNPIIFLSNGFQCHDSLTNASGATYIYASWAESPFCNSSGVPNNAR